MLRSLVPVLGLCLLALGAASSVSAQDGQQRVVLSDGSVIVGVVRDADADPVVVVGTNGVEQRIPRHRIVDITGLYAGRFTRLDPNNTRLFLTPNGRTLGRGSGRFSTYTIFPSVAYGLTDRIDVSVGAAIPAIDGNTVVTALNLNAKVQLAQIGQGGGLAIGGNAVVPISSEADLVPGIAGTFYGVATLGSDTRAVTLGAGGFYGTNFEDAEIADGLGLVLGYEQQLSSSVKFISENLILVSDGSAGILTAGVRFFGDKLAADVSAVAIAVDNEFVLVPIPYVGLAYNFGR